MELRWSACRSGSVPGQRVGVGSGVGSGWGGRPSRGGARAVAESACARGASGARRRRALQSLTPARAALLADCGQLTRRWDTCGSWRPGAFGGCSCVRPVPAQVSRRGCWGGTRTGASGQDGSFQPSGTGQVGPPDPELVLSLPGVRLWKRLRETVATYNSDLRGTAQREPDRDRGGTKKKRRKVIVLILWVLLLQFWNLLRDASP